MTEKAAQDKEGGFGWKILWLISNGPAIITVLGSAAVAGAASVLQLSQIQILQAVMALLALIGTSLLTERLIEGRRLRNKLDEIHNRLDQVLTYARDIETTGLDTLVIRRRDLPPLEERLDGAKRIAISGGSLFRLVNEYKNLFEQLAEGGCKLRFLITDPDTSAVEFLSSTVVYESNNVDTYRTQMRTAVSGLLELTSKYPDVCQVKLCAIVPSFSLLVVEKGSETSVIQVELYPYRLPARERPTLLLDSRQDPRLYRLFSSQYEAMWNSDFSRSAHHQSEQEQVKSDSGLYRANQAL